jgi:hypothetical protein
VEEVTNAPELPFIRYYIQQQLENHARREEDIIITHFGSRERAEFMGKMFPDRYKLEDHTRHDGTIQFYDPWTGRRTVG